MINKRIREISVIRVQQKIITMKKKYLKPAINMVKLNVQQLICVSGELDRNAIIDSSDGFGSRRGGSFWDADDEEY